MRRDVCLIYGDGATLSLSVVVRFQSEPKIWAQDWNFGLTRFPRGEGSPFTPESLLFRRNAKLSNFL